MIDSQKLKTQTSYSLKLHDVRKAAAAYELMHSAAAMLQMLPVPVLEALRDYVQEEVKDRKGPLTLCDRSFVEHLNDLIRGARLKETPETFSGLFWSGSKAIDMGLADGYGTVDSVAKSSFTLSTSAGQKVTVNKASATTYRKGTSSTSDHCNT